MGRFCTRKRRHNNKTVRSVTFYRGGWREKRLWETRSDGKNGEPKPRWSNGVRAEKEEQRGQVQ